MNTSTATNAKQLCHCMNVFPGTTAEEKLLALKGEFAQLKKGNTPFPVGIWLDAASACELENGSRTAWVRKVLNLGYYAYTANAFPYGPFHNIPVKKDVYLPDWTSKDRLEYTISVAKTLAELCPIGQNASISTVPGGYKENISREALPLIAENLLKAADELHKISLRTGKTIRLAIEMEPDCLWEAPEEFAAFYDNYLRPNPFSSYIGVCYDTCHQELLPRKYPSAGLRYLLDKRIPIVKIQLSAAIQAYSPQGKQNLIKNFQDTTYLHQTRMLDDANILHAWKDLPQEDISGNTSSLPWLCHFHIPVYSDEIAPGLRAAKDEMLAVLKLLRCIPRICDNLEIETYSYHVLPDFLKEASLSACMEKELAYVGDLLTL